MNKVLIQIYEIQTPEEATNMAELGVDHIGSVLTDHENWKSYVIKDTIDTIYQLGAKSSLIPLFNDHDTVCRALDYYRPDLVHFCEMLVKPNNNHTYDINYDIIKNLIDLQDKIRKNFPQIKIVRSIPIALPGFAKMIPSLNLAEIFEPISDFFLTDTLIISEKTVNSQPVEGFVGITGKTCDWNLASLLVENSRIPVILAGGISPDNACEGILEVRPAGIDSCTLTNALNNKGEPVRFKKDLEKVKRLIMAVEHAEKQMALNN